MNLPTIPYDKALHVTYGAALSLAGAIAAHVVQLPVWFGALALPAAFAIGKEVYDRVSDLGTPDPMDAAATVAGALPAVIVSLIA